MIFMQSGFYRMNWAICILLVVGFSLKAANTNLQPATVASVDSWYGPQYDSTLAAHLEAGGVLFGGTTNSLLLKMSWFLSANCVFEDDIGDKGQISGELITPMGTQGGGGAGLNKTNLSQLKEWINALPSAPTKRPPKDRWLLISGIYSNHWSTFIFDRRNVPLEVEKLFELTGMRLEWSLPIINSTTNFPCPSSRGKSILSVAGEAPVVASFGLSGAQFSEIQNGKQTVLTNVSFGPLWFEGSLIISSAVSPDGHLIAIGRDHQITMYDLALKKVIWDKSTILPSGDKSHNDSIPRHLAILDDDKVLVVNRSNGPQIEKWDATTGEMLGALEGDPSGVQEMAASPDGRLLAVAFGNGLVRVWGTNFSEPLKSFLDSRWISSIAFSPDGRYLATSGADFRRSLEIWDWRFGRLVLTRKNWNTSMPDDFDSIAWSPDGSLLAASPGGQAPIIFETRNWKPLAYWGLHPITGGGQTRLAFLPDGSLLGQNQDGGLELINSSALKELNL